jgi:hypothetical protein
MKALHLISLLAAVPASAAAAAPGDMHVPIHVAPPPRHGGMHRFRRGGLFIIEEPDVVVEREVVLEEAAPPAPPPPPPPPRKPYVIGRTYSSLPGGCMKLIERGASYYQCSGEWYRQVAPGRYLAVRGP